MVLVMNDHILSCVPESYRSDLRLVPVMALLRRDLTLEPLTPEQRRQCQGKWFLNAADFASRAADAREAHAVLLMDLPFSGADITAQRQRVAQLEDALLLFQRFTKDIADTLLQERAVLFPMSTCVLRCLEEVNDHPFKPQAHDVALEASIQLMRREFDRRNKKISRTKREQAPRRTQATAALGKTPPVASAAPSAAVKLVGGAKSPLLVEGAAAAPSPTALAPVAAAAPARAVDAESRPALMMRGAGLLRRALGSLVGAGPSRGRPFNSGEDPTGEGCP